MKDEMSDLGSQAVIMLIVLALISFLVGASGNKEANDRCTKYESIGERINIPYVVGCEMFKPRYK